MTCHAAENKGRHLQHKDRKSFNKVSLSHLRTALGLGKINRCFLWSFSLWCLGFSGTLMFSSDAITKDSTYFQLVGLQLSLLKVTVKTLNIQGLFSFVPGPSWIPANIHLRHFRMNYQFRLNTPKPLMKNSKKAVAKSCSYFISDPFLH